MSVGNSPYQWTNALLAYMRSNLWSSLAQASAMAVVLLSMHTALCTLARSPPGNVIGNIVTSTLLQMLVDFVVRARCHCSLIFYTTSNTQLNPWCYSLNIFKIR